MFIVKGRLLGTFLGLLIAALGVVQLSTISAGSSTCEPPLPGAAATASR
ncbi:MAG TPA: hypothetical protein VMT92_03895 [Steroidobacteraceae bacterium]|nr:hypothetical protein [Steroidobacteraceae bacterium]